MEEMTIMAIIWHALKLMHPKKMILSDISKGLIILKSTRLRLELRLALCAAREKMIYSLIDINIMMYSAVYARTKSISLVLFISLSIMTINSLTTVFNACNLRPIKISFPNYVLRIRHKLLMFKISSGLT
jgi:hypothetical protein